MQRPRVESAAEPRMKRADLLFGAALVIATLLVYVQVWDFAFISVDDPVYVPGNPYVLAGLCAKSLRWSLGIHDANWIPLTWWSLMLDSTLFGIGPMGYHITNVVLHVANTLLLLATLVTATSNRPRSAFVAALFAIHPLHVESVAWVAERKDVLSIFFGLLSLWAYVGYAQKGKTWRLLGSFLLFLCSLLSKPTLVSLPFVFLLLDYWPLARLSSGRLTPSAEPSVPAKTRGRQRGRTPNASEKTAETSWSRTLLTRVAEKIPFFLGAAACSAIAIYSQSSGGAMKAMFSLPLRCGNAVLAYLAYLEKTAYPINLGMFYPHPIDELSWTNVALAAAILLVITVAAVAAIRRLPFLFVGWFWYLGTLVPMIGLVQVGVQQMADRYTYFPLIGIFLAIAWLLPELAPHGFIRERVMPIMAVAAIVLFSAISFNQVSYWHDSLTLLRHTHSCTTDNAMIHNCLASALFREGNPAEAAVEFQAAIKLSRPDASLHNGLGASFQIMGRKDEALEQYRRAAAISPQSVEALIGMASILIERGQLDDARAHLQRARELDADNALIYSNLASLSVKAGDFTQALSYADQGLGRNPRIYACDFAAAQALRGLGRFDEGIGRLQRLLEVAPGDPVIERELKLAREHQREISPSK
jgi:tetratricopeptide (TPR) repeat protein